MGTSPTIKKINSLVIYQKGEIMFEIFGIIMLILLGILATWFIIFTAIGALIGALLSTILLILIDSFSWIYLTFREAPLSEIQMLFSDERFLDFARTGAYIGGFLGFSYAWGQLEKNK